MLRLKLVLPYNNWQLNGSKRKVDKTAVGWFSTLPHVSWAYATFTTNSSQWNLTWYTKKRGINTSLTPEKYTTRHLPSENNRDFISRHNEQPKKTVLRTATYNTNCQSSKIIKKVKKGKKAGTSKHMALKIVQGLFPYGSFRQRTI